MPMAAEEALAAVRRDAGNIHALVGAAQACFAAGQRAQALALLHEGVSLVPQNATALRVLSGFLAASGAPAEALPFARRAAAAAPAMPEIQLHLAHIFFACRQYEAAVAPLQAALALQPREAASWRMLATAWQQSGRFVPALEAITQATTLAPGNVDYALQRASLLNARACHGDALAELRRAAQLAPEDARLARAMSSALEVLGDLPAARAQAARACALAPADAGYAAQLAALDKQLGLLTSPPAQPSAPQPPPPPLRRRARPARPGGRAALRERGRIIWAIALREMRTRHSRAALGYLWALAEPISHLLTLGVLFAYVNRHPPPIGDSLFEFYCTGLLPYLLFAHISGEVMHSRSAGAALLLLPRVRTTDVMLARCFLQFMTELAVAALVFSAFGLAGYRTWPAQPLICFAALALLAALGLGAGGINMVILNFFTGWETVFNAIIRLLYFASGIYYTPISMPDAVRAALVWNPVLQGVELFRTGFFAGYDPFWLNIPYLLWWSFAALAVGLGLERALRRRLRRHA